MKYLFPDNLFSRFLANSFSEEDKKQISFLPSAQITAALLQGKNSIGLIPTLDLLKHEELSISKLGGISFESEFCNSYFYYPANPDQKKITEIILSGDVSSIEAILCKILFAELYDQEVKITLQSGGEMTSEKPVLLIGDNNFINGKCKTGISFADEVIEILSAPFVNFVFASKEKKSMEDFNNMFVTLIPKYYDAVLPFISSLEYSEEMRNKIKQEFSSFVFDFDSMDLDGIAQLTRLPFYHGMIKEMIDIKFV
ncbi:MAG: hypothetical protein Q8N83_10025 [Ignavibacteria bacterium]|nr:hypothetical protein [Ignavibacteria bacterium]